ncbi:MAG: class I SAM-dependent methyltransferase [Pseudomonadota bacterium]
MAYQEAMALQRELHETALHLAAEMQKMPSERDATEVRRLWSMIDSNRARLNSLNRRLRKIDRLPRTELSRQAFAEQQRRVREGKVLTQRLRIWEDMAALVARHADPAKTELHLHTPPNDRDAMLKLLGDAVHALANPNTQLQSSVDHGCFADIALPIKSFEDLMRAAYRILLVLGRTQGARFLDVGCGGGSKVIAASLYFAQCDGLEYDEDYVVAGQKTLQMTGTLDSRIFHADGLTFDGYAQYDVVYFYRPLYKDELLQELENRVIETARPGTLIVAPYHANLAPREGFAAASVVEPIFITGYTQDEANALLREAEKSGTEVVTRPKDMHFDPGFWSPILEAASFN